MKISSKRDEIIAETASERRDVKVRKEHSDVKQLRLDRKFMDLREFLMSLQNEKTESSK